MKLMDHLRPEVIYKTASLFGTLCGTRTLPFSSITSILSPTYLKSTSDLTQKYLMIIKYLPHIYEQYLYGSCTVFDRTTTVQVKNM